MKTLKIAVNLDSPRLPEQEKKQIQEVGYAVLLESFLNQALAEKYPKGLDRLKRKVLARVQARLDACELEAEYMEIEDGDFDFIRDTMLGDDVKFSAQQNRLVSQIIKNIEDCEKASRAKEDEPAAKQE